MISDRFLLLGLVAVIFALAAIVIADDGMTACQATHSFDVCHDALN